MTDKFPNDEQSFPSFHELLKVSDEDLMASIQRGNGDALRILFDRFHRLVLHIGLTILHDVGEAEDTMQTIFMDIYRMSGHYDPERGSAKKWILRCAYNRAINRRKHLLRRQFYGVADLESVEDRLVAPGAGITASHEAKDLVVKGFENLNDTQRKVIELAYFEGLTLREIADHMGESLGNVRHHYYRGLKKLRSFLREPEEEKQVTKLTRKEIRDANA